MTVSVAFIRSVDRSEVSDEVGVALEAGGDLRLLGVLAHAQGAFRPWLRFSTALLSRLELSPLLRELAILQVAVLVSGGEYEWAQHAPLALAAGATAPQLEALRRGAAADSAFSAEQVLALRFVEEVVRDGVPHDETRSAALDLLGPRQVVELLLVIGQYMMVARVIAAAGLEPEAPAQSVAQRAQL